jgi:hypothetical protein
MFPRGFHGNHVRNRTYDRKLPAKVVARASIFHISAGSAGLFNGKIFSCRPLISTYVIAKMTVATISFCQ